MVPVVVLLAVTVPFVPILILRSLLLQVPPDVASVSSVVEPSHKEKVPDIAAGCVTTVTIVVDAQAPIVYDITEVPIVVVLAVTRPVPLIVATVVVTLLHPPPDVASVSCRVDPSQITPVFPVMAAGCVVTVTTWVT